MAHLESTRISDSHAEAVRRVLFQYLKRQTRRQHAPTAYLNKMAQTTTDPNQFKTLFRRWTFAARPALDRALVYKLDAWVATYLQDPTSLHQLVTMLQTPRTLQGGASATRGASASIVLLNAAMDQVLLVPTPQKTLLFPGAPVQNTVIPKHLVLGNALRSAKRGLYAQTGYGMSKTYVFLGERLTGSGDLLYLFKLTKPKPGHVLGKDSAWVPRNRMPQNFATPAMWSAAFDLPLSVRRFSKPGGQIATLRRTLVDARSGADREALLKIVGARPKDLVFVRAGKVFKLETHATFAHPILTLPETQPLAEYVKLIGITHLYVQTCSATTCESLRATFPSLSMYVGAAPWTSNQAAPTRHQNPALVAKAQGTPGFLPWFYKTYKTKLEQLGSLPFECTPDGTPYRSQQLAIYLASPECPAITRLLDVHRTGSGKTKIMHLTLGSHHKNDMAKIVIVPSPELRRNFFAKLVNTQTLLSAFVRHAIPAFPMTGKIPSPLIYDNLGSIMKLLAIRHQSGRYQLKRYKTYLQNKAAGRTDPPFGTEPWAPMSPLRCESFGSLENMLAAIDDTPAAFAAFETQLKAGEPCVPVGNFRSQYMFQPQYRYKQDGVPATSKKIKNPFDDKIIVIDEIHELFTRPSDNPVKRRMMRLLIQHARGGILVGLTATPIVPGDTDRSQVLDMIKGPDASTLSSDGFISYFNDLVEPLFPTTIPRLFQRLQGGTIPVLGRIVFSPLYGANYLKYLDRARQIRGPPSTKALRALQTFLNTIYTNASAGRNGAKLVGANLADFAANANKLDCLDKLINQYPKDKTLVLFAGGARSYYEYVKRKYPGRIIDGTDGAPTQPKDRMGFMFRLSDPKKIQAQNELLGWFSGRVNLDGSKIRVLCANAQRFGTGVDFPGIRHLILVNVPHDVPTYLQELGRTMRSCVYAPLPKDQRNVRVDLMVSTMDPKRTLNDLMDKSRYQALRRSHHATPHHPVLTYDEIHLRKLYDTFDAQVTRLNTLIAAPAIDKPWLQNLVPTSKVSTDGDDGRAHVIYCDGAPPKQEEEAPITNPKKDAPITVPAGKTSTLKELLENLTLPSAQSASSSVPSLLNPTALVESLTVPTREALVDALIQHQALGLLLVQPVNLDRDTPDLIARSNVRWAALATQVPAFTHVTQVQFYHLAGTDVTVLAYVPNTPLDKDSYNLRAVTRALHLDPAIQRPPAAALAATSDAAMERVMQRNLAAPDATRIQESGQRVTVFIKMYFPDISIMGQTLTVEEYKQQPAYIAGILAQVRTVLNNFFTPYHNFMTVKRAGTQISAQINNVPLAWLKAHEPDQPRLYYQLEHLNELSTQKGWRTLPYNGKLVISLDPIKLEAVGHLEPQEILAAGDVYLDQDDTHARLQITKAPQPLATQVDDQAFQDDADFVRAVRQNQPAAYLENQDPPRVVPTKAYASVKDFAARATPHEWNAFWRFTDQLREKYAPSTLYLSTDPIQTEPGYFALNVLAQPGYPAYKLAEWKYKQADQERLAQVQKQPQEVPIEKIGIDKPIISLPPIQLPDAVSEVAFEASVLKPKTDPKDTLLTLIIVYTELTGDPHLILAERSTALETVLSLPMARVPAKTIGTMDGVRHVLDRAVQRDGLMPVKATWLQTGTDPVALVTLSPGSILDRLGYSPDGAFTGRRPWPLRKLPDLPQNLDGRSLQLLRAYVSDLKK